MKDQLLKMVVATISCLNAKDDGFILTRVSHESLLIETSQMNLTTGEISKHAVGITEIMKEAGVLMIPAPTSSLRGSNSKTVGHLVRLGDLKLVVYCRGDGEPKFFITNKELKSYKRFKEMSLQEASAAHSEDRMAIPTTVNQVISA